jgi:hypothetical protein
MEFDLLIGQPIERLIQEGQTEKLNIHLRKNFKLSLAITHSLNAKTESCPEPNLIKEDKVASLEHLIEPNLDDDAEFFIEEEGDDPLEPEPLDDLLGPLKSPIELKPLPASLRSYMINSLRKKPCT